MKYIIRSRGMGKTTELIDQLKKDKKGILVVMNENKRDRLRSRYKNIADRIITCHSLKEKILGRRNNYYLDNGDKFLQEIFDWQLKGVSFNE